MHVYCTHGATPAVLPAVDAKFPRHLHVCNRAGRTAFCAIAVLQASTAARESSRELTVGGWRALRSGTRRSSRRPRRSGSTRPSRSGMASVSLLVMFFFFSSTPRNSVTATRPHPPTPPARWPADLNLLRWSWQSATHARTHPAEFSIGWTGTTPARGRPALYKHSHPPPSPTSLSHLTSTIVTLPPCRLARGVRRGVTTGLLLCYVQATMRSHASSCPAWRPTRSSSSVLNLNRNPNPIPIPSHIP